MPKQLSQKAIREVVQAAGTVSKKQLVDALGEADISFNASLLDGFLEQALEKWLSIDDKNKYSIRKRASSGGGTPTRLYKLDDPMNPQNAKLVDQEYDKAAEEKDDLLKRTPLAAIKAAKAHWYTNQYWPNLEAYRVLEAANSPKKENPDDAPAEKGKGKKAA